MRWVSSLRSLTAKRWAVALASAVIAGYLTAFFLLFPAPLLHAHEAVPRVIGLNLAEASSELKKAGMQVLDGGSEPNGTAPLPRLAPTTMAVLGITALGILYMGIFPGGVMRLAERSVQLLF